MYSFNKQLKRTFQSFFVVLTKKVVSVTIPITCTAREGTSQSLVDKACEHISYSFAFYDSSVEYIYFDLADIIDGIDYHLLPADDYMFLSVTIEYHDSEIEVVGRADGDFDIKFGDVSFNFSTVAN